MDEATTDKQKRLFLRYLHENKGLRTPSLQATGVSRTIFGRWFDMDPVFRQKVMDIEDEVLDFVEERLFQLIEDGDRQAIIFFLKTRGRRRGYIERQEQAVHIAARVEHDHSFDLSALSDEELHELRRYIRTAEVAGQGDPEGIQGQSQ